MAEHQPTATAAFVRPRRTPPPAVDTAEIAVPTPPQPPGSDRAAPLVWLPPVVLAAGTVLAMAVGYRSGPAAAGNPVVLVFPLMMLVSAVAAVVTSRTRRPDADTDRCDYLDQLADLRLTVTGVAAAQRTSLMWCHPQPNVLWTLAGGTRMWERQPDDDDFGAVRLGVGHVALASRLVPPQAGSARRADPVTADALRRLLDTHSTICDVPVAIELFELAAVTLDGDRDHARGLLRAVLCQLAVLHGPDLLLIVVVSSYANRQHWDWLKWLPHHQHPTAHDGAGPARMAYPTLVAAGAALAEVRAGRQVVVVVDGGVVAGTERITDDGEAMGVTIVEIGTGCAAPAVTAGMRLRVGATELVASDAEVPPACPDRMTLIDAVVCARRLAGYRLADSSAASGMSARWAELVGIDDVTSFDPSTRWGGLKPADRLRVPIGVDASGEVVHLDVKQAAESGMGPHGLCIGATGSGKSELLRTIALGMMARHSPDVLNLVLVDFKGGSTFLGMEKSRHVAAVITNLADEAPLVARMRDALAGELNRRQELLRSAGNFTDSVAYADARRAGAALPALPALFVIVDEFSELLSQHPDFAEMFVAIGRLGRSLGIHLLLASQRLDEGRLHGLESHLSYRICLKTLSANESRIILGIPDAYQLPNTPGVGYLYSANGELARFATAFVSGPCPQAGRTVSDGSDGSDGAVPPLVRLFTATPSEPVVPAGSPSDADGRTVMQAVLDGLSGQGPPAHQVWLPPLDAPPTLGDLLDDNVAGAQSRHGELVVPIGVVDRPFEQRRTPLLVDLRGAAGNVAVVGAPHSGKSTALATLITGLAATHDPVEVQCYGLDFGGGMLASLRSLPQLGSVAGRREPDLVRRTVSELESIVARREALFDEQGINSMSRYRSLRAEQDPICGADRFGDVFLVIDGWASICSEFGELEASIVALAGRGLSFGVHVVLSASRWAEIRPGLRDQIATRIELRLGDPADSEVDRRQADQVPRDRPGRGLIGGGLHVLIALPELEAPVRSAITAPSIPLLPAVVHRHSLVATGGPAPVLGIDDRELRTVTMDFEQQPHLVIIGDTECGKTSVLRTLCAELVRTHSAEQARLLVVDYRRSLLGDIESEHLDGYATSAAAVTALLADLMRRLAQRMPGPDVTVEQLRNTSWWSGPQLYLLIDDYDLVAAASGNPLTPLLEYLPHAGDIGLHVVLARRSGGAARAMYEPLPSALRDLGCMGLVMSGNPDEGPLIGSVRPVALPPGRGMLVTRVGGEQLVQVAWTPT